MGAEAIIERFGHGATLPFHHVAPAGPDGWIRPSGPIQPISASVIVARPGDLAPFFNDAGISDDANQAAANFDGLGVSYSEQALTAAAPKRSTPADYSPHRDITDNNLTIRLELSA